MFYFFLKHPHASFNVHVASLGKNLEAEQKVFIPFTRIFHLFKDLSAGRWEMPKKVQIQGKQKKKQVGMDHL